jgi:hypothetical protein
VILQLSADGQAMATSFTVPVSPSGVLVGAAHFASPQRSKLKVFEAVDGGAVTTRQLAAVGHAMAMGFSTPVMFETAFCVHVSSLQSTNRGVVKSVNAILQSSEAGQAIATGLLPESAANDVTAFCEHDSLLQSMNCHPPPTADM